MNKKKLKFEDAEQAEFFRKRTKKAFQEQPYLKKLQKHLLQTGGIAVVLWNGTNDEDIVTRLLNSGQIAPGQEAVLQRGKVSECHENSKAFHQKDPERYEVRTGYALNADGIWRPHSWVVDSHNDDIIETTEKRTTYFGVVKFARQTTLVVAKSE